MEAMMSNYFQRFLKTTAVIGAFFASTSVYAYEFSLTNATGGTIGLLVYGVGEGNMMTGEFKNDGPLPTQKFKISNFGNTETINNAGHLDTPLKIQNGHTVVLEFTNWDIGVCFDLSQIKVGFESNGFNMVTAAIKALPNEWYDTLFNAAATSGGDVSKIGKAIGEKLGAGITKASTAIPDAKGQAIVGAVGMATEGAGLATEAIGSLVGTIAKVIRASSCKNMSFVAVKTKDAYTATLLTRQE